jgi:hypothetical protein
MQQNYPAVTFKYCIAITDTDSQEGTRTIISFLGN